MAICLDRRDPALQVPMPNGRRAEDRQRPDTVTPLRLVHAFGRQLAASQVSLPEDDERLLRSNLWELYE